MQLQPQTSACLRLELEDLVIVNLYTQWTLLHHERHHLVQNILVDISFISLWRGAYSLQPP